MYLDHNATTPVLPEVFEAMAPWFVERFGNPSSRHPSGREAAQAIELARGQVARSIGATPDTILFTGGGTEASNLAIRGVMARRPGSGLVISAIEHPATTAPSRWLESQGTELTLLAVDAAGKVSDPLPSRAGLVSVMHANNETGVVQPIAAIAERAHGIGALLHTDAAQSLGKIPVDVRVLGADLLTIAGHKLYGPKGVGALFVRQGIELEPVIRGAGHERGLRPGTENVPAIVGLGMACAIAQRDLEELQGRLSELRDQLWQRLREVEGLVRTGSGPWLPNTLHVRFPGVSGNALLDACPEVQASTGSACHADGESPSSVLLAMGVPYREALGSVRLSLGRSTTERQIEAAAAALITAYGNLAADRLS